MLRLGKLIGVSTVIAAIGCVCAVPAALASQGRCRPGARICPAPPATPPDIAHPCRASKAWVAHRVGHKIRFRHGTGNPGDCEYGFQHEPCDHGVCANRPGVFVAGDEMSGYDGHRWRALKHDIRKPDRKAGREGYFKWYDNHSADPAQHNIGSNGICIPASGKGWIQVDLSSRVNAVDWHITPRRARRLFRAFCNRF